ncbi:DUF6247 family protein [Actinomycetospora sp. CA-084318]|uniref:DUF6247 family protein n=1 Tax=Actinomycetospora sp. CA-084318 TaxID=3239892 RepID=UPI003D953FC1
MTTGAADDRARPHPLRPGATPATIRAWLATDEDRAGFVAEYGDALERARRELDISGVHEVIERWRRVALLQSDPAGFRHVVRYAAEQATGVPPSEDEPLEVTRRRAGI